MEEEGMRAWHERMLRQLDRTGAIALVAEPKLDGAAIELVYEDGRLTVGATRGDGLVGEDVTANLRQVLALPTSIPDPPRAPFPCTARSCCRCARSSA